MSRSVLSRYQRDAEGNIVIDVFATRVEDVYNDFDKSAPYIRRDLDREFANYLIDCGREVGREPFVIRLSLVDPLDEMKKSRVQGSINTYFSYLAEIENQKLLQMFRRSTILFAIGLGILFCSVWLNRLLGPERSVTANVFAEGLTIAAWVSLWEALALFLLEWFPHRKNVMLYRSLAQSRLTFGSWVEADQNSNGANANDVVASDSQ